MLDYETWQRDIAKAARQFPEHMACLSTVRMGGIHDVITLRSDSHTHLTDWIDPYPR